MNLNDWQFVYIVGLLIVPTGAIYLQVTLDQAAEAEAKAHSYQLKGKVARFAVSKSDESLTEYAFKLVDDPNVYYLETTALPAANHGELTLPGDMVEFWVYPGFKHVRGFRNSATNEPTVKS